MVEPFSLDVWGDVRWYPGTCECVKRQEKETMSRQQEQERLSFLQKLKDRSGMSQKLLETAFETWEPRPGTGTAFEKANQIAEKFRAGELNNIPGLLLFGIQGNGKTHLAAATANQVLAAGHSVAFQNVPDLLGKIKDTYNDPEKQDTENRIINRLISADLLILDDLGAEKWTEWVEATIYQVVDRRYRTLKPIFITTNCEPDKLPGKIGARAYDRLLEMCILVHNKGDSYRRIIAQRRIKQIKEGELFERK